MIQRIQSVYLFISVLLIGLLFLLPFAEIAKDGAIYLFNIKGVALDGVLKVDGLVVAALSIVGLVIHGWAIFSYKNRKSQMKIVYTGILLLVVLFGLFLYFTYVSFSGAQISLKIGAAFPLVAIILDYLAIRAIGKDEALIRSIDRIR